jgi:KDO2-lipid IV(A) lauroyltransferase
LVHVVAAAGLPITSIAKPLYDPRLTRFVHRLRTAYGHRILWRGDDGVPKELLRVFRQNGVLGLLIDQDTRVQGAFVPFFGRPAHTPTAAASLAIRHDAALLMVCGHRAGRRHQLQVERIPLPAGPDHDARVLALTRTLSAWLEAAIRRAPEQWVWLHDRWRRQPDGPTTSPAP